MRPTNMAEQAALASSGNGAEAIPRPITPPRHAAHQSSHRQSFPPSTPHFRRSLQFDSSPVCSRTRSRTQRLRMERDKQVGQQNIASMMMSDDEMDISPPFSPSHRRYQPLVPLPPNLQVNDTMLLDDEAEAGEHENTRTATAASAQDIPARSTMPPTSRLLFGSPRGTPRKMRYADRYVPMTTKASRERGQFLANVGSSPTTTRMWLSPGKRRVNMTDDEYTQELRNIDRKRAIAGIALGVDRGETSNAELLRRDDAERRQAMLAAGTSDHHVHSPRAHRVTSPSRHFMRSERQREIGKKRAAHRRGYYSSDEDGVDDHKRLHYSNLNENDDDDDDNGIFGANGGALAQLPGPPLMQFSSPARDPRSDEVVMPGDQLNPIPDARRILSSFSPVPEFTRRHLTRNYPATHEISSQPTRVLDAPSLANDFYLNLLDWSSNDVLSVGLVASVYLWKGKDGSVTNLCNLEEDDRVTSVSWRPRSNDLAVGTNKGYIRLWDAAREQEICPIKIHEARVSVISWAGDLLTAAGRDRRILFYDLRQRVNPINKLPAHSGEICGLRWNADNVMLASGGNDRHVRIWDARRLDKAVWDLTGHSAAIKALAWSPQDRHILLSGGGSSDGSIRVWNTEIGEQREVIYTKSQVCNLAWSPQYDQFVSTHGYVENDIRVWNYSTLRPIISLNGHTSRVLYMALSPNGRTIATGSTDHTLRFWDVFPPLQRTLSNGFTEPLPR